MSEPTGDRISEASTPHEDEVERIYLAQAWDAATGSIKAAIALNGGASIAILALIGSMIQGRAPIDVDQVTGVLLSFCYGLMAGAATQVTAYFAIYCFHQNYGQSRLGWKHADGVGKAGVVFHLIGMIALVSSFVFFARGVFQFADFAEIALATPRQT